MKQKKFDQINVLPFIDIMLVLLVIVLTGASFISKGKIPMELPKAKGTSQPSEAFKSITIDKKGNFYFQDRPMSFRKLAKVIEKLDPHKSVLMIKSDAKSHFQSFIDIIDLLKSRGFEKIEIETKR